MIFEDLNRQKRNFFHVINFRRINVQIIDKFPVNLRIYILITEGFQTFFPEIGFVL